VPAIVVANNSKDWPFQIPNVEIVDARSYLTKPEYSELKNVRVFNLCRSYRYQAIGYYVSLLAEARGHRPLPAITTVQDLKSQSVVKIVGTDLEELIQHSLKRIVSNQFELSIYFGRNMTESHQRLATKLFNQFQAPLLRAHFVKSHDEWLLKQVSAIPASEVPERHWPFVIEAASRYFEGQAPKVIRKTNYRFDLAILTNEEEQEPPSNEKAIERFVKAGHSLGIRCEIIARDDYARLAEFDALFIRETTAVNHHTYRFAQRASSEGLVVMDDPLSIVKCSNKVYLAELMARHKLLTPKTLVTHKDNWQGMQELLGIPLVLKKPDSAFSKGVIKVSSNEELEMAMKEMLADSDLVVAQEYLPTDFDWRIGIIDRQPIFACKYYMAPKHWQIIRQESEDTNSRYGRAETLPVEIAPRGAVRTALKAANLIGDGFYGVDIKESDGKFYVVEVNDNPNVDRGVEDTILRDELYNRVMRVFLKRIEMKKASVYQA
jgi:glutathione synthase/RimK-type ligase-like ATP-grasp enzyme